MGGQAATLSLYLDGPVPWLFGGCRPSCANASARRSSAAMSKRNDYGFPVERVGFPVDEPLDPSTPVEDVARRFDSFV